MSEFLISNPVLETCQRQRSVFISSCLLETEAKHHHSMPAPPPLLRGLVSTFPSKELSNDVKRRAEALFPYLKHLAEFDGLTMGSFLSVFQTQLHPESEVFLCEDFVLIVLLAWHLVLYGGDEEAKEHLEAIVACWPLPTANGLAKPMPLMAFELLSRPPTPEDLYRAGLTSASVENAMQELKFILHAAWSFCRITYQSQVEVDIPKHIKLAIWVAKKAILTVRRTERERLRAIKTKIVREMHAVNLTPLVMTLNLAETMEGSEGPHNAAYLEFGGNLEQ